MTRPFRLRRRLPRRAFLTRAAASVSALALAGCDSLSRTEWFPKVLNSVEPLNEAAAKLVARKGMAQEFAESDRSPSFRSNGTSEPDADESVPSIRLTSDMTMDDVEREAIRVALEEVRGNRRKAAERLGIGERTLYRKLRQYELDT